MALANSPISEVRVANAFSTISELRVAIAFTVFLAYLRAHLIFNVFDNAQALLGVRGTCLLTDGHLGKMLPTEVWNPRLGTAKWFKQTSIAKGFRL